jgi:DNA-binding LytR/AlgR family response regulator
LYAEMSARKVCLHLQGADRALLYTTATMADLADLLENHGFVRTHKSVLVNMEHIRNLQSTRLYLRDGTELPVSSQPVPCGKSIRSGGARKNGLLVRDCFQLLGRAVRGRFLRCVS